jgi:uncharacterized protein YndB with AHSA1/START domain
MIKWTLIIVGTLAALVAVMAIIGVFMPVAHRASRTVNIEAPPERVFAVLTDVERYPEWRPDVKQVSRLADAGGAMRWQETGAQGTIPYRVIEQAPPARWVVRIDDPSLPYGGSWTYELRVESTGTSLTITEDGEVYHPIFRFLSRTVFSTTDTIEAYQDALRARFAHSPGATSIP